MTDLLKIDNHVYNIDPSEIDSEFVNVFSRTPDHVVVWPEFDMNAKKFPKICEFVEKSIDFFTSHDIDITTSISNSEYNEKLDNGIKLYAGNCIMRISTTQKNKAYMGITKENFHLLLKDKTRLEIAFTNDSSYAQEVYNPLFNSLTVINSSKNSDAVFNIIEADPHGGMYLNDVQVKLEDSNFQIEEMYNDDFPAVHQNIMKSFTALETGLVLLHGGFGTGKTSYIRRLIKELSKHEKRVIYMPPNMANSISTPSFMTFLIEHKESIIVIEDAENILRTREANENSSVANILNSTDGLLGDALKLQFICTFNADRQEIDPALFRKGRLLQEYEFTKLHVDKARKLWLDVGNPPDKFPETDMPISDIFNHGDRVEVEEKKAKTSFGFIPNN